MKRARMRATPKARARRREQAVVMSILQPAVLARDGWRCQARGLLGGSCSGPLHAHHRQPRGRGGRGGPDTMENLVALCWEHHEGDQGVHGWREHDRALELGLLVSLFDPAPTEAWSPPGASEPLPRLDFWG